MAESPALQAYRRQMFARWEAALATVLAAEPGAGRCPAEPFVAAVALVAVVRAAFEAPAGAAEAIHRDALAALALLERGLGGYATASLPIPDKR